MTYDNHAALFFGARNFAKSLNSLFVACRIFDMLFVDGHRALPSLLNRLLLLKAVGSRPPFFAKAEQVILLCSANFSIAVQTLSWVMSSPLGAIVSQRPIK